MSNPKLSNLKLEICKYMRKKSKGEISHVQKINVYLTKYNTAIHSIDVCVVRKDGSSCCFTVPMNISAALGLEGWDLFTAMYQEFCRFFNNKWDT